MSDPLLAQPGVLTDPTPFAEYLTFVLHDGTAEHGTPTPAQVTSALTMLDNATKSISQKDTTAEVSTTIGFSARAWPRLFPDAPVPAGLAPFPEMKDDDRHFPSTAGDIFVMVKSNRIDLNLQVSKYVMTGFAPIAELVDDIQGYKYLDDRDLIDFVDGTENPGGRERADAVLADGGHYAGGSYLVVQRYVDRMAAWDALTTEQQEGVIGRTKMDDIELADDEKKPFAHNVKSKVTIDGTEVKMYRQNRAFGTALKHGTMFIGFAGSADVVLTSLRQMIIADDAGNYDHLLDFVDAETGAAYFVPPAAFIARD
ncbi:MAG: Dyp-type peroxidase [Acidimicrobiales bacterium]